MVYFICNILIIIYLLLRHMCFRGVNSHAWKDWLNNVVIRLFDNGVYLFLYYINVDYGVFYMLRYNSRFVTLIAIKIITIVTWSYNTHVLRDCALETDRIVVSWNFMHRIIFSNLSSLSILFSIFLTFFYAFMHTFMNIYSSKSGQIASLTL